jgi:hypothetical protein
MKDFEEDDQIQLVVKEKSRFPYWRIMLIIAVVSTTTALFLLGIYVYICIYVCAYKYMYISVYICI